MLSISPGSITYLNTIHHPLCQYSPLRSQARLYQSLDMCCLEMPCHGMLPWQARWPQPLSSCRQPLSAPNSHLCLDSQVQHVVRSGAESLLRAQWGNVAAWHPHYQNCPTRMLSSGCSRRHLVRVCILFCYSSAANIVEYVVIGRQ